MPLAVCGLLEHKTSLLIRTPTDIGQSLVTAFLQHGAIVVAVDIKTPEHASEEPGHLTWFQVDQTSPESITKLEKILSDKYASPAVFCLLHAHLHEQIWEARLPCQQRSFRRESGAIPREVTSRVRRYHGSQVNLLNCYGDLSLTTSQAFAGRSY